MGTGLRPGVESAAVVLVGESAVKSPHHNNMHNAHPVIECMMVSWYFHLLVRQGVRGSRLPAISASAITPPRPSGGARPHNTREGE